ncbi:tetratricopeptide repeat protein [Coleofasciculus chthonoplastes]|uniref:tetratricopeptide repeat protein n=1 Tax=Coleofasciculus chthonoplastes TaxID=64178 RepID=UPI0032F605D7
MTTITIREQESTDSGFTATLSFDGRVNYPIAITDPFTPKQEQILEWYFEQWLVFSQLGTVKAVQAKESVKSYGEQLFEQVFRTNIDAYSEYRQIRGNLSQLQIEIESQTPEFQALHWEALRDPDLPRPLAVDCLMLRKHTKPVPIGASMPAFPVINLLLVTARPDEERDVGYRTISRPLIEAIETAKLRVNVELLRPGTYQALSKHLEEKGAGYYHIIHFDAHGSLMSYDQVHKGIEKKRYTFQARWGREDIDPYEGVKAFLFLEGESQGKADPVEASELAGLLTGKGIPVCILNACQSGKQISASLTLTPPLRKGGENAPALRGEDARETSLGSRLMAAGMHTVVAMGYSVTVTAASLLIETVYRQVFAEKTIREALRLGRRELFNNKGRKAYYNQTIDLEDWLLPVVYTNQPVNLNLREFTPQEEEDYYAARQQQYRFTPPTYGFVGRDLEILKIEKALLRHTILLLRGMGGTGKTTLLNYLREWWQTTHFAEAIFYFGYDTKAWTLKQILREISKQVYEKFEFSRFQAMNPAAQVQKLAEKLKTETHILILDNLESVTGKRLAIKHTLSKKKREEIQDFISRLVGGKTRVVLGSRSGEEWLQGTFGDNVYRLQGLDIQARSELAQKILERYLPKSRIPQIREDKAFIRLMKLLAGYPLAMEVVLANLKQQSPAEIVAGLEKADIALDSGSEDKTESIVQCVEYSHRNLSAAAQQLLLCLAPFSGFIHRDGIGNYVNELQQLAPFQDYPFDEFDGAIQEAINWGLLSPSPSQSPQLSFERGANDSLLRIQPVFPYFLRMKLNQQDAAMREALREGFKRHYLALAGVYQEWLKSKQAEERQMGIFFCQLEYENLYNALQLCLEKQETVDIFFCLFQYFLQINDIQSNLKLSEFVCQAQAAYPASLHTSEIGLEIVMAQSRLAYCYLETQNYAQAKATYQQVLELYQQLTGVEERQKQLYIATTYHQLGAVTQELREYEQAKLYCQQALDICIEFRDRYEQASTYHNLGAVAQALREYEQAKLYYQQALDIYIEFRDRYEQASTYHNLGFVAQELREYEQAKIYYQQALDIYIEFSDRFSQAGTYHNLGIVAEELREYEQAKGYYQQALDIYIELRDRYSQARTYHQLGRVAQELREYEQARLYYQQALDIYIEFRDRYSQARTYHQLGIVAQELREYEQAKLYYQQALDIFIEFRDRYSQASTYHNLGAVAEELREYEQAKLYYQQALDIKIEFSDRYSQASTYHQLGRVAQKLREYEQARLYYQQALDIYIEFRDRFSQAGTYHHLGMVAEELREYEQAKLYYHQALDIYIELRDRYEQAKTYHCLGLLAEAQENYAEARVNLQTALEIYLEYQDDYWADVVREALAQLPD